MNRFAIYQTSVILYFYCPVLVAFKCKGLWVILQGTPGFCKGCFRGCQGTGGNRGDGHLPPTPWFQIHQLCFFVSLIKLSSRRVLDLQNYSQDSTEDYWLPHTQYPLLVIFYIIMVYSSHLINKYLYITITYSPTLFRFPLLFYNVIFYLRTPFRAPCYI